jgi:glycosyltransferase involved in cell wall biosynthesis
MKTDQCLDGYLKQIGLPGGVRTMSILVATEHAGVNKSGGIGTFVANQCARDSRIGAVLVTTDTSTANRKVVLPENILSATEIRTLPPDDIALRCVEKLVSLLPSIRYVEYQEYGGIGARISQAKSAGILPNTLTTVVHCHGNQHYLENANERWMHAPETTAEREKISIELADIVVFPTDFLRSFYRRTGIKFSDKNTVIAPYWYDIGETRTPEYSDITNIVFVGKQTRMKGIDLFFDALTDETCAALKMRGVNTLVFVGPAPPGEPNVDTKKLSQYFAVEKKTNLNHAALMNYTQIAARHSLFVEPYRADNFPLAVYDIVSNGGTLLASNSGGIPEIFSSPRWKECLFECDAPSLAAKMIEAVKWTTSKRSSVNEELRSNIKQNNNKSFSFANHSPRIVKKSELSASVCVPFFNTDAAYVVDLFSALNRQTVVPREVIIVDDGSNAEYSSSLKAVAEAKLRLPFRIIHHQKNRGLAAARNTALSECTTDILLNVDSDDVPLSNWIQDIQGALSNDPQATAAVPYLGHFNDGEDFNSWDEGKNYTYRPLGDGYVLAHTTNCLGHANSGVMVSLARKLGGWDESSKAKWEDWAFFLGAIGNGYRIAVIPRVGCLYRIRENSMVRAYPDWPGSARLAYAQSGLPMFETIQLQRFIHKPPTIRRTLSYYTLRYPRLRKILIAAYLKLRENH